MPQPLATWTRVAGTLMIRPNTGLVETARESESEKGQPWSNPQIYNATIFRGDYLCVSSILIILLNTLNVVYLAKRVIYSGPHFT